MRTDDRQAHASIFATEPSACREVLLAESGDFLELGGVEPFSLDEMVQKYRHGGVTATLGTPKSAYVEGNCVGGGSE